MTERRRRWLDFVPGARVGGCVPVAVPAATLFYLYAVFVCADLPRAWQMARSPIGGERLDALAVLIGLFLFYCAAVAPGIAGGPQSGKAFRNALQRFQKNRMAVWGLGCVLFFLWVALLAPLLAPFAPTVHIDPVSLRYQPPSPDHWMGTDKFGRDVFSRVLYGARVSLAVGVLAVSLASVLGLLLGAFSGYIGGRLDDAAMRIVDGLLAFPRLLLVLTLLAFFAHSFWLVVLLLGATGWMGMARLVRSEVLSLREREFVQAAVASGVGRARIVFRHLVPNALGPAIVGATLRVGTLVLLESYLSFLGLGVQPPTPSWGSMVFEGRDVLLSAWWVPGFPGLAIVAAVVSCNLLGDGLRDAMDVRSA